MMHISENGLRLIEGFEGFSSKPYFDRFGGVWTRGFGETEGIGPNSPHITRAQGEANLKRLIEQRYEPAVRGLGVQLNQNQWDALCSFVWNLGTGIFTGDLRHELQTRQFKAAADRMLAYDHAGGVVLEGLRRRRQEEMALFLKGAPANPLNVLLPSERKLVNTLDAYRKHPSLHRHGIAVTKKKLVVLRKLIWLAAVRGHNGKGQAVPKGWGIRNRGARYAILQSRTR